MRIIGIIAEYNPFHLGHLYQINKIKELYPNSLIIAIISPCFTERGDISIINKWDKTKICLDNNIDLVVELPTLYATQSADIFAHGAIQILNDLGIDTLVFGTESDNIDEIINLANIQLNNKEYDLLVKKYLDEGINYPTAMSKALYDLANIKVDKPNDLLALSYVKEIIRNNYKITPVSIKRTNDYHGKSINNSVISANLIRELISKDEDINAYIPNGVLKYINKVSLNNGYNYLLYNIINNIDNLDCYLDVSEGIHNKIIKHINDSDNWYQLVNNIKSKRYTYNKINRMLIHILLGIKKTDNNNENYIKILGFNNYGRDYLNKIKKNIKLPLYYGYKPDQLSILDIEFRCLYIYSLIVNDNSLITRELENKPIIK